MAISNSVVTVGATATLVFAPSNGSPGVSEKLMLYNDGAQDIFIGGPGVTAVNGMPIAQDKYLTLDVRIGADLYAIVAATTANLRVLAVF